MHAAERTPPRFPSYFARKLRRTHLGSGLPQSTWVRALLNVTFGKDMRRLLSALERGEMPLSRLASPRRGNAPTGVFRKLVRQNHPVGSASRVVLPRGHISL